MNEETRKLFSDLGSKNVKDLAFRDSWVFVGAKGVQNKSPFEQVWAQALGPPLPGAGQSALPSCLHPLRSPLFTPSTHTHSGPHICKLLLGLPRRSSVWGSALPLQGARVQSLVGELRSCMPSHPPKTQHPSSPCTPCSPQQGKANRLFG